MYFEGGDLGNLPKKVKDYLMTVTKNIEIDKIPFRVAELQKTQRQNDVKDTSHKRT